MSFWTQARCKRSDAPCGVVSRAFQELIRYNRSVTIRNPTHSDAFLFMECSMLDAQKAGKHMDRQPGNMHWLQNNNDRQTQRPGNSGGPNGQGGPQKRPSYNLNRWLLVLVAIMLVVYIYNYFSSSTQTNTPKVDNISYTQLYQEINAKNIKTATFVGQSQIQGQFNTPFNGYNQYQLAQLANGDPQLPQLLINSGATVSYQPPADNSFWLNLLINLIPWVLLIGYGLPRLPDGQEYR